MEVYTSEHEQVEALRRWWEKNFKSVIALLVVVIAGVLGWRNWQERTEVQAQAASAAYQLLLDQINEPEKALAAGRALIAQYPDSEYAVLASLAMGATAVNQNDLEGAAAHLRFAMGNAKGQGMKQVAATRLARVLLAQQKPKEALQVLDGVAPEGFDGEFHELRGDIHLALGDRGAARGSYEKAVSAYESIPAKLAIAKMKLDDVADASGSGK